MGEENNFNGELRVFYVLLVVSAVIFCYTGEKVLVMEKQNRFDYANPVYVFNVLTAISSVATGGFALIKISSFAENGLQEEKKGKETMVS